MDMQSVGLSFSSASCVWQPHEVAINRDPTGDGPCRTIGRSRFKRDFPARINPFGASLQAPPYKYLLLFLFGLGTTHSDGSAS